MKQTWVEFLAWALRRQIERQKPQQSFLWVLAGLVKTRFPALSADEAWGKIDATITKNLGGWEQWLDKCLHWSQGVDEIDAGQRFCDSWTAYLPSVKDSFERASKLAERSVFPLPLSPLRRSPRYETFLRFCGYASFLTRKRVLGLSQRFLADTLEADKNTIGDWLRWAQREKLVEKTQEAKFKPGARAKDQRAARYRTCAALRDAARDDYETTPSRENPRENPYSATLDSLSTNSNNLNKTTTGSASRSGARSSKTPKKNKIHSRWVKLAEKLYEAISKNVKRKKKPNLNASALAFRSLHKNGGGESREQPTYDEIAKALEIYCRKVAQGDFRTLGAREKWPVCGSGTSFRDKWDKVQRAIACAKIENADPDAKAKKVYAIEEVLKTREDFETDGAYKRYLKREGVEEDPDDEWRDE